MHCEEILVAAAQDCNQLRCRDGTNGLSEGPSVELSTQRHMHPTKRRFEASIQLELFQMLLTLCFSHLIWLLGLQQHMAPQNEHINVRHAKAT